jgi:hypothetical protein
MELQSNALIDIPTFKAWFRASPDDVALDPELTIYINAASDLIEAHCRRVFQQATLTEGLDGDGGTSVYVSRPPIDAAQPVTVVIADPFSGVTLTPDQYVVYGKLGKIALSELVVGLPRQLMYPAFPIGRQNIQVTYTGGYAAVPAAVQLACCLAVAASWYGMAKDPLVATQAAGGASQTRKEPQGVTLPAAAVNQLVPYVLPLTTTVVARDPGDPYPLRVWWRGTP